METTILTVNNLLTNHNITALHLFSTGLDTSCSGHGLYQKDICGCVCNLGWEGPNCSVSSCPDECNDNGRCVDGKCVCHQGYTGDDCSQLACPNNCNDKGQCVDGKCVCYPHFTGKDCSVQKCPSDCTGNGRCMDGQCICDEGFYGEDCSLGKLIKCLTTSFFPLFA